MTNLLDTMTLDAARNLDLELAVHQIPEYLVLLNTQGEVVYFNREAERLHYAVNRPVELGISFINTMAPDKKKFFKETLGRLKENKLPVITDATFKYANDSTYFFEINYIPILDAKDELTQICIIAREITPQKIYEKKTNQLVHELFVLIEDANAIVIGVDSLGCITDWNRESVRITEFDKDEVFTQQMSSLIDPSSGEDFDELLEGGLNGELMGSRELLIKTKSRTITALMNATPKKNSLGHVIGVLFVGQDISELANYRRSLEEQVTERTTGLKKALEKEKELVDIKNKFVSIASHEFKLPLATIGTSTNLIKSNKKLTKSDRSHLDIIQEQIKVMRALLEDVLVLERSGTSKLKANFQRIDIVLFLGNISDEIVLGTGQTHQIITTSSQPTLVIESDERLLRNIFSNILSNAIKFSPQKKEVFLDLKNTAEDILITVQDNGMGIPADELKKIFEPFNRGSNASEIKGTGLGLSIVKKATETLGGTLSMESQLGVGTKIAIKFKQTIGH